MDSSVGRSHAGEHVSIVIFSSESPNLDGNPRKRLIVVCDMDHEILTHLIAVDITGNHGASVGRKGKYEKRTQSSRS